MGRRRRGSILKHLLKTLADHAEESAMVAVTPGA
jgi:hypothetical protein